MSITSKRGMYQEYNRNRFGNRLRSFDTLEEYQRAGNLGLVALRSVRPGGLMISYLDSAAVERLFVPGLHRISEHAPDAYLTMQGELQRGPKGWELFFSTVPGYTMKEGLPEFGLSAFGLTALALVKFHMDESSYDDLMGHFDDWPDAVVEFSCYGNLLVGWARRNTLFWEIRQGY